jgi:hypothetical protein
MQKRNLLSFSGSAAAKGSGKLNYLLVLLLTCVSGNSAFDAVGRQRAVLIGFCCLLAAMLGWYRKILPTPTFLKAVAVFSIILIFQGISFGFFPTVTVIGLFIRMFIAYAVLRLVSDFPRVFVRVLFHISIISMLFYIPDMICSSLNINFRSFFEPLRQFIGVESRFNLLVYNFQSGHSFHRNSACFGEPGIFVAYILLAIVFLGLQRNSYFRREYNKLLLVLIISLLTTFSTTGYVLLPLSLWLHPDLTSFSVQKVPKLMIVSILLIAVSVVFYRLDFVGGKITEQYEEATMQEGNWYSSRIGTFFYDMEYIKRRPVFGWGIYETTRYSLEGGDTMGIIAAGQGNGLTDFVCKFGIAGLLTWSVFFWKGILGLAGFDKVKTGILLLLMLLLLNGEPLLNYPLFMSLMFLNMKPPSMGLYRLPVVNSRGGY